MSALPLPQEPEIEYPESDGKPMAESDVHRDVMTYLVQALRDHFAADPQVYVAGNLLIYWEKGSRRSVAPDVFVVQGVSAHKRDTYLLWEERKAPGFVLEVTSKTTREEDEEDKKSRYALLGVEEYFLFDPRGEYLRPRFQALRLSGGEYHPMPVSLDGSFRSRKLGVAFLPDGESLRMWDVATGLPLLAYEDWKALAQAEKAARQAAEECAVRETAARQAAEGRAEAAEKRAAEAEARAQALAAEIERLRRSANK